MTCLRLLGPEAKAGRGLLGEDESGPRQDREEPGGGKDLGDEAPVDILKDTGRRVGLQERPAAHTGCCGHHPRLGAQLPNPFLSFMDSQGGSPRAVMRDGSKERQDVILMGRRRQEAAGSWGI